jgi:predicted nucleotidyltransferase component of viral defense system
MNNSYRDQVNLLLEILPYALKDKRFALKGGTAINLFHRDFPRLSVDIDLCYLPLEDRDTTYKNIHSILAQIKNDLIQNLKLTVQENAPLNGAVKEVKLVASRGDILVKIEPNYVVRGALFPPIPINLSPKTSIEFQKSVTVQCLASDDTYGGKLCAALDRQHPRDLFDVKFLLENGGITTDLKDAFILYLISHKRPINEILDPNFKDLQDNFTNEFENMTIEKIELSDLLQVRIEMVEKIKEALTDADKEFLISFVSNTPKWDLLRDKKIAEYPSVNWKLLNQSKMKKDKQIDYIDKLEKLLGLKD